MEYSVAKYEATTPQNPATELCHETVLPQSNFWLSVLMSSMNACICLVNFISMRLSTKSFMYCFFFLSIKNVCAAHFDHLGLTLEQ